MRVRLIKQPPSSYAAYTDSLRVGRIYNLNAALAGALIAERCAELRDGFNGLTASQQASRDMWTANDPTLSWSPFARPRKD